MDRLVFGLKRGRAVRAADLQDDPGGSFVVVTQSRTGGSRQLSQRGQAEQNGPRHQSPACTESRIITSSQHTDFTTVLFHFFVTLTVPKL